MADTNHFSKEDLIEKFSIPAGFRNFSYGLIGIGFLLVIVGGFLSPKTYGHEEGGAEHGAVQKESSIIAVADYPQQEEQEGHGEEGDQEHHGDEGEHHEGDESHADSDASHEAEDSGHHDAASSHSGGEHGEHHSDDHGGGHGHHAPTWITRLLSGFLLNTIYFMTIGMGALFFLTVHRVGNSGWHTVIKRIPEAMFSWVAYGAVGFGIMLLMMDQVYEWLIIEPGADELIDKKRAYLNWPFFAIRTVLFFGIWIFTAYRLRRLSLEEDENGGLSYFYKALRISAAFVVLFAITYSLFAIDWIKSLEPHWFSTIFGVYIFAGSMASAMATMSLIIYYLKQKGYMKYVNFSHLQDVNTYTLGFSIFWAYIWLSQFLLIWYSNIPEEGIYYVKRYIADSPEYLGYSFHFYVNLIMCFVIPFFGLIMRDARRNPQIFVPISCIVLIGHWNDLYQMIMPGTMFQYGVVGLVEIGFFLLIGGLFILVVFNALTKANLVPLNHPYLEESLNHTTGPV